MSAFGMMERHYLVFGVLIGASSSWWPDLVQRAGGS
jgi:hypothetical protein